MSTSAKHYDAIEQLIFDDGIKIASLDIHPDEDVMVVLLNTKAKLNFALSSFPALKAADKDALLKYELIANGTGVHWPLLDEDLSLKGFLQQELKRTVNNIAA